MRRQRMLLSRRLAHFRVFVRNRRATDYDLVIRHVGGRYQVCHR
jgi:hypothetical protein